MKNDRQPGNERREFLSKLATTAAAAGLGILGTAIPAGAAERDNDISEADEWFKKVQGKHKIVFDVPEPRDQFTFMGARIFLMTNAATGSSEKDCGVVLVLRHAAIPYALSDDTWSKYKLGEALKMNDPATKGPAMRNPFWQPKPGDFTAPGIGTLSIGINELQASGVMICVCDVALSVRSHAVADSMKLDPATVQADFIAGVLPGIQRVPSGVWAVGRAQEHGCAYCFVG